MNTKQIGIVSAPTAATLAYVADYKRREVAARQAREQAMIEKAQAIKAEDWQKLNQPFGKLLNFAEAHERKQDEVNAAASKRQSNGRFKSKSAIAADIKKAVKLKVLGCNGK